ncbi:MAG TPA: LCP family protein [Symbiobacteriaceae bacterium]|nr:LCP family protein [Symbiobacteriaceae bacterium]
MGRSARRRSRRWIFWLLSCVTVIVALVGCVAFYRPFASKSAGLASEGTAENTVPPPPPLPVKRTTFLVMGVDKREDDSGRADSMMVVSFDTEKQQLAAVSLPRDTWVAIPGHGYDKLNHAFAYGGEKLAVATVQQLVGIPIDHYVTVTFQDFAKIVDAVGGIDIDAEKRMYYEDPSDTGMGPNGLIIDIQPGLQHMDGITALKYSRFRMDEEGDLGRVRRQQQVVMALLKAAARPAIVTKVPQLIPALSDAIDTDMSVAEMVKYGLAGKDAVGKGLKTGVFAGEARDIGGVFYFVPDLEKDRKQAYEVLVGAKPTDTYMARAREDQAAYAKALAAEVTAAEPVVTASAEPAPADSAVATKPSTEQPATTKPTTPAKPAPAPGSKPSRPAQLTVAVTDASGKQIASEWVTKLKAAGFRVARVSRSSRVVAKTVAIDHAGQAGTEARLTAIFPGILVVSQPDTAAEEAIQLVLGSDLIPKTTKP